MRFLRTNTACRVTVGPFFDKTDGVTPETSLTVTACKLTFMVDDSNVPTLVLDTNPTASSGNNDMVHVTGDDAGFYDLELTAANTNYVGRAMLAITDAATHCPVFHEFMILPAVVYDSLVLGSDNLQVDAVQVNGTNQTGRDIGASVLLSSGTGTGQISLASGLVTLAGVTHTGAVIPTVTTVGTLTTYTGNTPQTGDSYARIGATGSGLTSLAPSATALSTATWTGTRAGYIDNLSAGAVALASGVYLANGAHGGSSAALTLKSINVSNSTGDAVTVASTGSDGHGIYVSANGGGDGMHVVGGATGHGLHLQGGSTSGDGLHAVAQTLGDGIQATGAGVGGLDINGTLSTVTLATTTTTLTNLPAITTDWLTGTGVAASAVTKIQAGLSTLTQTQVTGGAYSVQSSSCVLGDARIANLDAAVSSRGTSTLTQTQVTGGAYTVQSSSCVLGDARIANLDAAVTTRSTYAGADTSGTTTLLSRVTSTRAGYLDNLSGGAVMLASSYSAPPSAATISTQVASDLATAHGAGSWATATGFSTHSAADVWAVATRVLTAGTNIVLAKGVGVTGFNDLSAAAVNAEVDTALGDYDGPTNTEMVAAFTEIKGATWATTDTLEAIRDRGDAAWITATGFSTFDATTDAVIVGEYTSEKSPTDALHNIGLDRLKATYYAGTDQFVLWASNSDGDEIATAAALDTANTALAKLDDTVEDNAGTYRFTTAALANAPTGGGAAPTAEENAAAVWSAAGRTLTAFSFTVDTNANSTETAIKAKTDNLPSDPADQSLIIAATNAIITAVGTPLQSGSYTAPDNTSVAAIKVVTDRLSGMLVEDGLVYQFTVNALDNGPTSVAPTAGENAAALLDYANAIEPSITLRQAIRVIVAACAGKTSGGGTGTFTIRDLGDTKDVVVATVDIDGNRSEVTLEVD